LKTKNNRLDSLDFESPILMQRQLSRRNVGKKLIKSATFFLIFFCFVLKFFDFFATAKVSWASLTLQSFKTQN